MFAGVFLGLSALTSNPDRPWEWVGRPFDPVFACFGTTLLLFPIDPDRDRVVAAGGVPDAAPYPGLGGALFLPALVGASLRIVGLASRHDAIHAP